MSRAPSTRPSRHLLRPHVVLESVLDITPAFLASHGLGGLLLDLDNTLIPYGSYDDRAEVTQWAQGLRASGCALYLLSNATHERARIWAARLGLPGVGLAGKPFAREYRRGLRSLNLPAGQVGMVGDQLFTDVLGGNWAGMFTIMVRPISDNALPHTRLTRRLERLVLRRYGHDWPGPRTPDRATSDTGQPDTGIPRLSPPTARQTGEQDAERTSSTNGRHD